MSSESSLQARELLARLAAAADVPLPSSAWGRLRRVAGTAARTGLNALGGQLRGRQGLTPEMAKQLVLSLGELKGIAMKMGQILSYLDSSLSPETRELLAVLQTHSQPTPFSTIERTLREDLGPRAEDLLRAMESEPVATASIGQVHRARLPDGTKVAVKIRHPGIESAIRADFRGAQLGKAMARVLAPGADIEELVEEARARFLEECDYVQEAARQRQFASLYAEHPVLIIPAVYPEACSSRVLTTSWQDGVGLDAFIATANPAQRDAAGLALYQFYLGSLYRHGLFNADPHPGNLLFTPDGRVAVLDHGCVREFDRGTVAALARLSRAVRAGDDAELRAALGALGVKRPDGPGFAVTRQLLTSFFEPVLTPGVRPMEARVNLEMQALTRDKRALLKLRLPGKLLFLFRIRFGLYAVLARLGARLDWNALEAELSGFAG